MSKSAFEKWYGKAIRSPLGGDYLLSHYQEGWLAAYKRILKQIMRFRPANKLWPITKIIADIKAEIRKVEAEK